MAIGHRGSLTMICLSCWRIIAYRDLVSKCFFLRHHQDYPSPRSSIPRPRGRQGAMESAMVSSSIPLFFVTFHGVQNLNPNSSTESPHNSPARILLSGRSISMTTGKVKWTIKIWVCAYLIGKQVYHEYYSIALYIQQELSLVSDFLSFNSRD